MKIVLKPSGILWISVLFYLSPSTTLSFLAATAIHELGHIAALYLLKKRPEKLTISITGCTISAYGLSYQQELFSACAGPILSLIGGLFYPRFPEFASISLMLAAFNLLPIEGLDGGRILASLLVKFAPEQESTLSMISGITLLLILSAALVCALRFPGNRLFLLIALVFLLKAGSLIALRDEL